jgi:hypothetical protein
MELATGKSPAPAGWKACPTSEPERFREPAFKDSVKMHPELPPDMVQMQRFFKFIVWRGRVCIYTGIEL